MLTDLELDANTGDLVVTAGRLALVTDDGDLIVQRARVRLRHWTNTWFLNRHAYVRYREVILVKGADPQAIVAEFRGALESIPGVTRFLAFEGDFDSATRKFAGTIFLEADASTIAVAV